MADPNLPYFKFISGLIDSGIWAQMSTAARTLYPVLLRFSDSSFKPVYPGSQTLLRLTGFKQKTSLRRARKELVDLGLVSVTEGSGRKNTCYHFRFDRGDLSRTPREALRAPAAGYPGAPGEVAGDTAETSAGTPQYNKIQISINNNVQESDTGKKDVENLNSRQMDFLVRRFGKRNVDLAISECQLAGIPPQAENLKKLLYATESNHRKTWIEMEKYLTDKISPGSLAIIRESLIEERDGLIIFSDRVPQYLRQVIKQLNQNVFFEPALQEEQTTSRHFWKDSGAEFI